MQLTEILVHNFRSIRDLTCHLGKMGTFLGPNNQGKSNILSAIEFLLSPGMKITKEDFFSGRIEGDNYLFVEAVFSDLTEQEKTTFHKYVKGDESIRIRKWASLDETGVVTTGYRGYLEQPTLWWLTDNALERLRTRDLIVNEANEVPELSGLLDGGGRITKEKVQEFQSAYISAHRAELTFELILEDTPLLGAKTVGGGILPDFYLVPAIRDLGDETRTTGPSMFSRLLQRAVSEMTTRDQRLIDIQQQLREIVSQLNERPLEPGPEPSSELNRLERAIKTELMPWGVDVSIRVMPPEIRKVFELGTELWLNDGHSTLADRKGHGLQRAVIFALIRAWSMTLRSSCAEGTLRARAASESLIIAYEEPELFLHPHAQRTLADSLKAIASTPEHQVLVCTHSTHFIDLGNYRSIVLVHRPDPNTGTIVRQCTQDLFEGQDQEERRSRFRMASWVNPDRGELFFATKVILVEGETEKTILPYISDKVGCIDCRVSVIDCGSKHNIPLYIAILNAFKIPYAVVHDEDPVPDPPPTEWSEEKLREKRRTFELNAKIGQIVQSGLGHIEMLSPDFERVCGISASQVEKKGKPFAALTHFEGLNPEAFPQNIVDVVRRVFST